MTSKSEDQLLTEDLQTPLTGTENKQMRDRWRQGYKTGRRSVCTDLALAIQHDQHLRNQIATADNPFEFLSTWIREFSKGTD